MPWNLRESIARRREVVRDDEIIEGRAQFLLPEDRDLLRAAWLQQHSTRLLASLSGASPRAIRYRVGRLIRRIHSPEFLAAVRLLPRLEGDRLTIARLHFCQGLSVRAAARASGLSYGRVRRIVDELRGMMRLAEMGDGRR